MSGLTLLYTSLARIGTILIEYVRLYEFHGLDMVYKSSFKLYNNHDD